MWSGLFENKPIDRESIIVAPTILNSYKNQLEDAYVVYPDAESVLGFLTYIYLPTAISGVFDHESADYIIGDDLDEFFREQKINNVIPAVTASGLAPTQTKFRAASATATSALSRRAAANKRDTTSRGKKGVSLAKLASHWQSGR